MTLEKLASAATQIPARPWVVCHQYGMTLLVSDENEIILGATTCRKLGDELIRFIAAAVNAFEAEKTQAQTKDDA